MRFKDKFFLAIVGLEDIGNFSSHYGNIPHSSNFKKSLSPVYRVQKNNDTFFSFYTGYIDDEDNFYECPILISYVEIRQIDLVIEKSNLENYYKHTISINSKIKIFNKTLSKYKKETVSIIKNTNDLSNNDFRDLNQPINIINNYIEENNNLDNLDIKKVTTIDESFLLKRIDHDELIFFVNNISINLYECSSSRAGKDNYFWSMATISSLPKDLYIKHLFINSLEENYGSVNENNEIVSVNYHFTSSYSPYVSQREYENLSEKEYIKDKIKIYLCINYKRIDHLSYLISF